MNYFVYGYIAWVGACIGSFLNVVIYRLPRRVSVISPRSRCTWCGQQLAWYHNIPVWSYLALRGRCATCRVSIDPAYVVIEVGTALVFVGLFHVWGWSVAFFRYLVLAALLIVAAEVDRRWGIIPDRLLVAGAGMGLMLAMMTEVSDLATLVPAAVVSALVLLILRTGSRLVWGQPGLGMGDVKLAAMMGLFLGWENLWVFYLAVLLGGGVGLLGLLTGCLHRTSRVPFAPFIALGAGLHCWLLPPSLVWPL